MMNREQWLAWRRLGIGGSDAATILGCSPWKSEWSLYLDKKMGIADEMGGEDIETGNLLEDTVIRWAASQFDDCWKKGGPTVHPEHEWLRASPDAWLCAVPNRGDPLVPIDGLEAKVSADYPWEPRRVETMEAPRFEVPPHYRAQVAVYMAVFDRPRWIVAVFFRRAPAWRLYTVERDMEYEDNLIAKCGEWWEKYIVGDAQPDIDASHEAAVGLGVIHGKPADKDDFRVATRDEESLMRQYHDVDETMKNLQNMRGIVGNRLRHAIGEAAGIRGTGFRCRWSRGETQRAGRLIIKFDY